MFSHPELPRTTFNAERVSAGSITEVLGSERVRLAPNLRSSCSSSGAAHEVYIIFSVTVVYLHLLKVPRRNDVNFTD